MDCERCKKFDKTIRGLLRAQGALLEKLYEGHTISSDQCQPELMVMSEWIRQIEELIGEAHCPKCWEPDSLVSEVRNGWVIFTCQACDYSDAFELEHEEDPYAEYQEDYECRESDW